MPSLQTFLWPPIITGGCIKGKTLNYCSPRSLALTFFSSPLFPCAGKCLEIMRELMIVLGDYIVIKKHLGLLSITDEIKYNKVPKCLAIQIHQNTEFLVFLPSIGPRAMSESKQRNKNTINRQIPSM